VQLNHDGMPIRIRNDRSTSLLTSPNCQVTVGLKYGAAGKTSGLSSKIYCLDAIVNAGNSSIRYATAEKEKVSTWNCPKPLSGGGVETIVRMPVAVWAILLN
jgi:hypothetical protein